MLFTEIGRSRTGDPNAQTRTLNQLQGVLNYQKAHPERMLGAAHFLFSNKVWLQTPNDSDSEGAFGAFRHGAIVRTIQTTQMDYDYYDSQAGTNWGTLVIDTLDPTVTHTAVIDAYR